MIVNVIVDDLASKYVVSVISVNYFVAILNEKLRGMEIC